jgi:putative methionine-R-sulfoxide reductase with GAF domain
MAVQGPLWAALQCHAPAEVLVSPVIVDGHVTLLLYAQSEASRRITNEAASRMEQVCEALSSSLLRLAG